MGDAFIMADKKKVGNDYFQPKVGWLSEVETMDTEGCRWLDHTLTLIKNRWI